MRLWLLEVQDSISIRNDEILCCEDISTIDSTHTHLLRRLSTIVMVEIYTDSWSIDDFPKHTSLRLLEIYKGGQTIGKQE
jgi:hypothetical protein